MTSRSVVSRHSGVEIAKRACAFTTLIALVACTAKPSSGDSATGRVDTSIASRAATAPDPGIDIVVHDAAGRNLGTISLTETPPDLSLTGNLRGLPPGIHGIHLHAVGRCEAPFKSAGDHWNPTNKHHGTENPQGPHLGDLQNITVSADSSASVAVRSPGGTLRGANPVLDADGASLVIHAKADDNRTDPSGNSGDRIACGVVRAP
jgi:Cu-Zn family superoxide dismutase